MKKYTASTLKDKKNNTAIEKDKPLRLSFSKILKLTVIVFVIVGVLTALGLLFINFEVKGGTEGKIVESVGDSGYDCIIILGAGVRDDGSMSDMLRDRMDTGIRLYFEGAAEKIIVSGDHGTEGYDEVNTMKQYAIECGVESSDIFMDHAGFSTYESIVRAKEIFEVKSAVVVTQRYHLYRALYIAQYCGLDAVGVSADLHTYAGQGYRDAREMLARCNDFIKKFTRPSPTYLGEVISITSDGDITNDR